MIRAALLAAALALSATEAPAAEVFAGRPCMGTVLEVTVEAETAARARRLLQAAFAEAERLDGVLSNWRPDTELSRFNARAGTGPVPLSRDLAAVLGTAARLHFDTDRTFDVTLGPVILAERAGVRDAAALRRAFAHVGGDGLRVRGRAGSLARRGMAVDLGGIGKGYAVDRMRAVLVAGGARSGFIDFGQSSQLAFGRPRTVQVRSPFRRAPALLELRDEALSTSDSGLPESSVLDPRTGARVARRCQATVVARSATIAEGWTKPLVVLGRAALAGPLAARLPGRAVLEDREGRVTHP